MAVDSTGQIIESKNGMKFGLRETISGVFGFTKST